MTKKKLLDFSDVIIPTLNLEGKINIPYYFTPSVIEGLADATDKTKDFCYADLPKLS